MPNRFNDRWKRFKLIWTAVFLERRDIMLIDPFEMSFPVPNSEKQFDAAFLVRPIWMPQGGHKHDIGIARIDDQLTDGA